MAKPIVLLAIATAVIVYPVAAELDVPSYGDGELRLSNIALTSNTAVQTPTARPAGFLQEQLPAPISTARLFTQDDEIAMYAELYTARATADVLDVLMTGATGEAVFESRTPVEKSTLVNGVPYRATHRIPLSDVPPGAYVLRMSAQSAGDGAGAVATRQIPLRVVPRR